MLNIIWYDHNEIVQHDLNSLQKLTVKFDCLLSLHRTLPQHLLLDLPALLIVSSQTLPEVLELARRKPINLAGVVVYCLQVKKKREMMQLSSRVIGVTNNINQVIQISQQTLQKRGLAKLQEISEVEVQQGHSRRFQVKAAFEDQANRFLIFSQQKKLAQFNDPSLYEQKAKPFVDIFRLDFDLQKSLTYSKKQLTEDLQFVFKKNGIKIFKEEFAKIESAKNFHQLVESAVYLYTLEKGSLYKHLNYVLKNLRLVRFRDDLKYLRILANLLLLNYFFFYGEKKSIKTCYRYTDFSADSKPGDVIMVTNFYSTSLREDLKNYKSRPTKIVINCFDHENSYSSIFFYNYVLIESLSAYEEERQVLFCPFTKFKVISVKKEGTQTVIHLNQIPDNPILRKIYDSNFLQENLEVALAIDREANYVRKYDKQVKNMGQGALRERMCCKLLSCKGSQAMMRQKFREAQQYFTEQLQLRQKSHKWISGFNNKGYIGLWEQNCKQFTRAEAVLLNNIGLSLSSQGKPDTALILLSCALSLKQKLKLQSTTLLSNIASVHIDRGEVEKALSYYEKSLASACLQFGQSSYSYAKCLSNKGFCLLQTGREEESLRLLKQSSEILQNIFGQNSFETTSTLQNLAHLLWIRSQNQRSLQIIQHIIRIKAQHFGRRHQSVLLTKLDLANKLNQLGREQESLEKYQEVVEDGRVVLGGKSKIIGRALFNVGSLQYSLCRLKQAQRNFQNAREILSKVEGENELEEKADKLLEELREQMKRWEAADKFQ